MADLDDQYATVETVHDGFESLESQTAHQQGPSGLNSEGILEKIISLLVNVNPWFILLIGIALYYFWQKVRQSHGEGHQTSFVSQNPDEILARQEAVEAARRRLQEQYDQKAREHAIKQKEKEEIARQEKIKNLEKYGSVLGRNSKTIPAETPSKGEEEQVVVKKKSEKPKLRPEYNPLMGAGSGGVCFRPSRRGGGAGGG